MDSGSGRDSRLMRSASVAESANVRSVCSKWKATENQRRILDSIFMSGLRNPSVKQVNSITGELRRHGPVEGKNVFYWFQNATRKEKLNKKQQETSSKWASVFKARNWTSLFRSKAASDKSSLQGEECIDMQEEAVSSGARRNSSVDPSEFRTLVLFPLQPEK